nr:unnamed protein product [Callosobruchus chinensis]
MSVQLGKVVSFILLERFGPLVERVGTYLFEYGTNPLFCIKKFTDLPIPKIKESLAILVKYQLVTFAPNKNDSVANYTLHPNKVLLHLRYPKYINMIKKKFGDEAEVILEEILQKSYWTASEVILHVYEKLKKDNKPNVTLPVLRDNFVSLVTAKYLIRVPYNEADDKAVPNLVVQDHELHMAPQIDIMELTTNPQGGNFKDKDIYWTVHFDRFHQDMRDKILVNAFTQKFDENAGELVKLLLRQMYIRTEPWADVSNPIPLLEIKDLVRKQANLKLLNTFFDQYVNVIEQDSSNLIRKSGEASGGSFQIFLKEAFTQFAWEIVEQCVLEKFDSKAARIFRLVKLKKYIDSDLIQQQAMIPAKEAKKLTFQLLEENFLQIQEIKKASTGTGPHKSFMLFHINLENVVRMILELCYKSLYNIMSRRNHERNVNKRIIDKKQRVETISISMRSQGATEEQLADIEDMITPPEKEILEKIDKMMKRLNTVELEVDDTIFLLQMYLVYQ